MQGGETRARFPTRSALRKTDSIALLLEVSGDIPLAVYYGLCNILNQLSLPVQNISIQRARKGAHLQEMYENPGPPMFGFTSDGLTPPHHLRFDSKVTKLPL